jgi:hypothetical protein
VTDSITGRRPPSGQPLGDGSHRITALEGGHLLRQTVPTEELDSDRLLLGDIHGGLARGPEDLVDHTRLDADLGTTPAPTVAEALCAVGAAELLGAPRLQVGELASPPRGPAVLLEVSLDLGSTRGELLQQVGRHADDLGGPVRDWAEAHPETRDEPGAARRLVDEAGSAALLVGEGGMQRRPAIVASVHEVGDEHVGVQLRVAGSRRAVPEPRSYETRGLHTNGAGVTAPREGSVHLYICEPVADRLVVGLTDCIADEIVTQPVENADGLRRREREIETRHSPLRSEAAGGQLRGVER